MCRVTIPGWLLLASTCLSSLAAFGGEDQLRRVPVPDSPVCAEVICDIGDMIASHRVVPAESVFTEAGRRGAWLLRNPQSPPALRWPRNLLNAGAEPPGLIIDPQLQGTCDVYAIVRAVDAGGAARPQPSFATVLKVARALGVRLNARVA